MEVWYSIAMSASGQYKSACIYNNSGGGIYYSTDYGQNWIGPATGTTNIQWNSIAMSASGQYTSACIYTVTGRIYTSVLPVLISSNLTVTGSVSAPIFNTTSDYRIKKNVEEIEAVVDNLRPVKYLNTITGNQDMGFIAHEVQELFPFLVSGEKDGPQNQAINYIGLIPLLVKEIQDLKKQLRLQSPNHL